ncbi:MAG: sulfotransferase [bacterium]|nr:sulfotransferase [bacterium]
MAPYRDRPDWLRRLNLFGPATGAADQLVPLDPEELLALARSTTGLEEIGDDDWLETYRRMVGSIDRESQATLVGRFLARAEILRVLQTRLRLFDAWAKEPAILEEPIERPIFVLGAPRTGTTILLELLALDPGIRAPLSWEAHHPLPHGEFQTRDARRALAESEQELWMDMQPEFATLHELGTDLPCECVHFLALEFGGPYWAMNYQAPDFAAWSMTQPEIVPRTYRLHRRFLQTLQYGEERRPWLLKSPGHLRTIEGLFAEYPDAVVVHTHRDPQRFVGSAASTTAMLQWLRSEAIDPALYGQLALGGFGMMLNGVKDLRKTGQIPDDQIIDSHFSDLMSDPVAAIRKIYDAAGLDWPAGHDDRITGYLHDKPKGKHGAHAYSLEEYGLDAAMVDAVYADYVEYYGIAREG